MRSETTVLNGICILVALGFLTLAVLNYLSEGSFLATDSLFITLVWMMLAALFLSVPAMDLKARGVIRIPFRRRGGGSTVPPGGNAPVTTDAKGRPMPPDVRRMVSDMSAKPKQ